ncbi:MAG: hypothetical protein AB1716_08425 [Planctomycetota bacterium]
MASIDIKGRDLTGSIEVGGSMTAAIIHISRNLHDPTDPNDPDPDLRRGHIIIRGYYGSDVFTKISMEGMTGSRPFISIDYDGYDPSHRWDPRGLIAVGGTSLYGNTPAMHVWECTACRGDADGNGVVDFNDINAWTLGLQDPRAYALQYPGLGALHDPWGDPEAGSRVWHGDCDCDGDVDFDDLNPFVARIGQPCSPDCPPGDREPALAPETVANACRTLVAPELLPGLRAMVEHQATVAPARAVREYWRRVQDYMR